ncbi:hypothetical protein AAFF_G00135290 [Aldrovandia affinis]|uniref:Protein FAM13A n=1 Tax=Aldrovandia affinis TaxID=143900 RepID=A0AAD7RPX5_9TELE|nr:hypothetical protein AAFF_G00135290 [Aldrovandia affinis]
MEEECARRHRRSFTTLEKCLIFLFVAVTGVCIGLVIVYVKEHNESTGGNSGGGKFCGHSKPKPFVSLGNSLVVYFDTNDRGTDKGFKARYTAVAPESTAEISGAGGHLQGNHGEIQSPGFPVQNYKDGVLYQWRITVPVGEQIRLTFSAFDLVPEGCRDYVDVYDSAHLGHFCGGKIPGQVVSSGNTMVIRFKTDASLNGAGFHASYTLESTIPTPSTTTARPTVTTGKPTVSTTPAPVDSGCGTNGVLNGRKGVIQSKGFPQSYPANLRCAWNITVTEGFLATLQVTDIALVGEAGNCGNDVLQVSDTLQSLGKHCGYVLPPTIVSSDNKLSVSFQTDSRLADHGFFARWEAVYPEDIGGPYCGSKIPKVIQTTKNSLLMRFHADFFTEAKGFRAYWTTDPSQPAPTEPPKPPNPWDDIPIDWPSTCGTPAIPPLVNTRIVNGEPAKPHSWPWQVSMQVWPASQQQPKFFHTCGGTLIHKNWVLTAAHCFINYADELQRWRMCFGKHNLTVTEPNEQCLSVLGIYRHEGFKYPQMPTVEFDIALVRLDGEVNPTNEVSFACRPPLEEVLPGGKKCYATGWGDETGNSTNAKVAETLNQVDLPVVPFDTCKRMDYWWFQVKPSMICCGYNKPDELKSVCQGDSGGPLVCQANALSPWEVHGITSFGPIGCIMDKKPSVFTRTSAYIPWIEQVIRKNIYNLKISGCGGAKDLTGPGGNLSSMGHPLSYSNSAHCHWNIKAPAGKLIHLHFQRFSLEDSQLCMNDNLAVSDHIGSLGTHCGSSVPSDLVSTSDTLTVQFSSNGRVVDTGFLASWIAIDPTDIPSVAQCGGHFGSEQGEIVSPGWPNSDYPALKACSWQITVEPTQKIHINFTDFHLQAQNVLELCNDHAVFPQWADVWCVLGDPLSGPWDQERRPSPQTLPESMGAGALTICHNRAAVQIKEDMKRMMQLPLMKTKACGGRKVFGVSLLELGEAGLLRDRVPLVLSSMMEFLSEHALQQEGLFRVNGNVRAVEVLRQRFESGEEVDLLQEGDACTVASLLKQFLRDLPEGLITATVQTSLLQLHQECGEVQSRAVREILQQLPEVHYSLLKYLCFFLTQVEKHHLHNRMTTHNLATVFGPNIFHVSPGFEGMNEQNMCNKILAKLIQNYSTIFESDANTEHPKEILSEVITVKETHMNKVEVKSPCKPAAKLLIPRNKKPQVENVYPAEESTTEIFTSTPRKNKATRSTRPENLDPVEESTTEIRTSTSRKQKAPRNTQYENLDPMEELATENLTCTPRKKKVKKVRSEVIRAIPQPAQSKSVPHLRAQVPKAWNPENMDLSNDEVTAVRITESLSSLQEDERPISPFYLSSPLSSAHWKADSAHFLERTIQLTVEQHLFYAQTGLGSHGSGSADLSPIIAVTTKQRCPPQRDQHEMQKHKDTDSINKENIPSTAGRLEDRNGISPEGERRYSMSDHNQDSLTMRAHRHDNQDPLTECFCESRVQNKKAGIDYMESASERRDHPTEKESGLFPQQSLAMKIQEVPGGREQGRAPRMGDVEGCEELAALTEHSSWGEPVPADWSWQRENMDHEEARLSPHVEGRPIQQLLEEDSNPMLSPRFYGYGHCQQYLDDTEVPPSPPNAHSFMSRRRSSSLGSCEEERVELTSAQLSKKIHYLKKKIRRFEERFEEERKYRPSHSDKATNPEVLRWMNELSKLRKELKEHKLLKSEEDLPPLPRPRSNTLPKSFGSQLDRKDQEKAERVEKAEKVAVPPVESTLDAVQKKLQEKREEVGRPEDIKDMTREQIGAEKVALQKALLYYENIHGRPVTKTERQIMKPLYDRYRLVKQILCRASTIPIIGSPSSKRRGLLLQPIIEGEPALFFDEIKEEEEGSEDDGDLQTQISGTFRPELSMLGFSLPSDELLPSKNSTDTRLSNLHSATMQELVEQLQEAREEKKRIRNNLREFEDEFFRQNGRNVQKEERSPLAEEYNEYKHIKAKLRLLEVLINKRDSSKFI